MIIKSTSRYCRAIGLEDTYDIRCEFRVPEYSWLPLRHGVSFAFADAAIESHLCGEIDKKTLLDLLLD